MAIVELTLKTILPGEVSYSTNIYISRQDALKTRHLVRPGEAGPNKSILVKRVSISSHKTTLNKFILPKSAVNR